MLVLVAAIVFLESGRRKIAVQYAKCVVGRRVYGGQSTHIPRDQYGGDFVDLCFVHYCVPRDDCRIYSSAAAAIDRCTTRAGIAAADDHVCDFYYFVSCILPVVLNPGPYGRYMKKYGRFYLRVSGRKNHIATTPTRNSTINHLGLAQCTWRLFLLPKKLGFTASMCRFDLGGTSLLIVIGAGLDTATY